MMAVFKFIWRLILNLILVPTLLAIIVGFVVGFITQDANQGIEASRVYEANRLKESARIEFKETATLQEPDFDAVSISTMITFAVVFVLMIVYMISDYRDKKKKQLQDAENVMNGKV
jgi:maltodextrin utilization protein YvdJ